MPSETGVASAGSGPDVFGFAGVLSPSLWLTEAATFAFIEQAPFARRSRHELRDPFGALAAALARVESMDKDLSTFLESLRGGATRLAGTSGGSGSLRDARDGAGLEPRGRAAER